MTRPVQIATLRSGVPGLDAVLGGGIPDLSFNVIAGEPGAGKTTLAQQIAFANATPERPALYFTVLGEPTIKLLRYQQQMSFFDPARVGSEVRIVNLGEEVLAGDLDAVFDRIVGAMRSVGPRIVVVDSFRTVVSGLTTLGTSELDRFVQRLAHTLTSWETTSFLVGEYLAGELRNPVFTVADGTFWMTQAIDGNSVVRKMQVVKMRGMPAVPGLHTMRITRDGIQVFPRTIVRFPAGPHTTAPRRLSTGVVGLDDMLGGGIPEGDTVILAGATGTGKTTFAVRFVSAGCDGGEAAVIVVFEGKPANFNRRAAALGVDVPALEATGKLRVLYLRPLDLSPDEVLDEIRAAVVETRATRVVIDSLSGFQVALAPTFRADFRESLYRVVAAIGGPAVTVLLTLQTPDNPHDDQSTPLEMSFVADDLLVQRHIQVAGQVRSVIGVVKMRGSSHSHQVREYTITSNGVTLGVFRSPSVEAPL